ncbi:phosphoribosyltransferase [Sulfurimonas sp. HSL-3221]|uniref:phosphoribosyltransferase n=1 Tax=Sulfurimonadaceae TaxID=2771471 RepID=UPI001E5FEA20|nr:phosphoribosyltransferase family protein [Sulfurimonas sp. HSL-3221]UFS62104.1 phosphoribosyltransferase [Sulfurimonas sp. HSL-3221]
MFYYSYEAFEADMRSLLPACRAYAPDMIVALARGGMMGAQLLGYGLDVRNIGLLRVASYDDASQRETVTIDGDCPGGTFRRILIVDDIVDSGKTLQQVKAYLRERYPQSTIKCAAPWSKPTACEQPDFSCREATEWIEFFWDRFDG